MAAFLHAPKTAAGMERELSKPRAIQPPVAPAAAKKPIEPDVMLWAKARKENLPVRIELQTGITFIGRVRSFGLYTVLLDVAGSSPILVFKNAMAWATIETAQ
jgi:sRNA-binding regulator protein Hfq